MPDDHSELVPPLPIPNRTVTRLSADDSAATSVKVGHRQAVIPENPRRRKAPGVFALGTKYCRANSGAGVPLFRAVKLDYLASGLFFPTKG